MRTSRISKDTVRLFDRATSSASSTPRRSTRSLSRFAYASNANPEPKSKSPSPSVDIEDSIPSPAAKRRRITSVKTETIIKKEDPEDEKDGDIKMAIPAASSSSSTPKRQRKPARKTTNATTGESQVEPPSDWEAMYEVIRRMRAPGGAAYGAAVDTMGCERLADRDASPIDQRFHTLIALMLSSQTKDTVNAVAMKRLQTELPPYKPGAPVGLNLNNILAVEPNLLNELIWAVGFHNNKTKYIKKTAEILRDEWNGDIPDTIEGLTALPGVGPKMGYLCLSAAWNKTLGIGVDVHVHRITNMWGWHKTKNPEETRLSLQSWLPKDRWREINGLLVGLGQAVCLPVGQKCGDCDLGLSGLCKAADRKKVAQGRKAKSETKEEIKEETKQAIKEETKEEDIEQNGVKVEVKEEVYIKKEED